MAETSQGSTNTSDCESSQPIRDMEGSRRAAASLARRRMLLKAGAAAVPVIMTLHAKTAWAGVPPPGRDTAYGTSQ